MSGETEGMGQSHRDRNTETWPQADGTDRQRDRSGQTGTLIPPLQRPDLLRLLGVRDGYV